jgi:cytochrome c biogenesis protein CcmG/thiol:disulfide interchange protein DsbE
LTTTPQTKRSYRIFGAVPLILFSGFAIFLFAQLTSGRNPQDIPSALIGKPVPTFDLPGLDGLKRAGSPVPGLASSDLEKPRVSLINVWASWCVPCRQEHPILMKLAENTDLRLVGLNYKDKVKNARRFLGDLGNPYAAVGVDGNGRVGIDWGVYGVPETFVVANGRIVYKFIGPLSEKSLREVLQPEIEKATAWLAAGGQ